LGSDFLDVNEIDPSSITLEGVSPISHDIEDVGTPLENNANGNLDPNHCTEDGPDGFDDLTLKFDTQQIVAAIGPISDGDVIHLNLSGLFSDGAIGGHDVVIIKDKKR